MKFTRWLISSVLVLATFSLASCADRPSPLEPALEMTEQTNPELLELLTPTVHRIGLMQCRPMQRFEKSEVIGPDGGSMQIGPHKFVVPRGALRRNTRITAVAPSGRVNHIEFQPHGLEFRRPATLTMSYANCDVLATLLPKHIAYTTPRLRIIELLETVDDLRRRQLSTELDHFSDYVLAW